jgi:hypothetical protein
MPAQVTGEYRPALLREKFRRLAETAAVFGQSVHDYDHAVRP